MAAVTLDEAKAHLRVDGGAEDADLTLKLMAAEDAAAQYINRPIPWTNAEGQAVPVPASVKVAILLILGDLYANREGSVIGNGVVRVENSTVDMLLDPYRLMGFA
ncbi:head-tail connector protein [Azospirillum sp. SYSU D00513]|uniref:head-tail connector protein n=1 Tax=Azospirillum sp. SYSU D00513 TaxID=2812561 RepID=UPI001A966A64|nr:head-tail connector protein [Azospirillum sp. SYSU D00513]